MASALGIVNTANEISYLAGIFNWDVQDAKYTTPDGALTVSFNIVTTIAGSQIPLSQYANGAINAVNLVGELAGVKQKDPNTGLFNTQMSSTDIKEGITRKYMLNRVPFANYDQLVDMGMGSQKITFKVIFCGTMYQTALRNFENAIFKNSQNTTTSIKLGTLQHPFYGQIKNVLCTSCNTVYEYSSLNYVICEVTFLTSDLTHLDPNLIKTNWQQTIGKYYVGTQNSIASITGTISSAQTLSTQIAGGLF